MTAPVIVIGAGLAGWTTVREFRKLDTTTPVLLVTADSGDFYAKPSLSNAFAQGKLPAQLVSTPADKMAAAQNVTLVPHTRVSAIDTAAKTITTPAGVQAYRQLVLATGAQPIRVAVEGNAADQVLSINSLQDFAAFHAHLQTATDQPDRHVLIMGAGLIGCEFANDLAQAGYRVSVVDPGARPLAALLPEAASDALQQALQALGVRFYWGTTVRAVKAASGADGLAVSLASGEELTAHGVLSAVGLRADTLLAQAAGLQVDRAIVVNTQLQTSAEGVYALGDNAQYASAASALSAHGSALPYVMPIMAAARALAANLAGTPTALAFALMPVSVKTPALPLVVAPPQPGTPGQWNAPAPGIWQWIDDAGLQRGFVLAGTQTAQRMAQSKLVTL
jgi:rubredoxin-NAD+ reductase